jgi:hypothetical protein
MNVPFVDVQPRVLARHRAAADHESRLVVAADDVLRIDQRDPASDLGSRWMEKDEAHLSRGLLLLALAQRTLQDQRPTLAIVVRHVSIPL